MGLRTGTLRLPSGGSLGRGSVSSAWAGTWLRGELATVRVPAPRTAADDPATSHPAEAEHADGTPAPARPDAVPPTAAVLERDPVTGACLQQLRALTATDSLAAAADALRAVVTDATGAHRVGVWLLEAGGSVLVAAGGTSAGTTAGGTSAGTTAGCRDAGDPARVALGSGLVGRCAAECRPVSGRTTGSRGSAGGAAPRSADGEDPSVVTFAHAAVPLRAGGHVIGVLDAAWDLATTPGLTTAVADDPHTTLLETLELAAGVGGAQLEMLRLRELDAAGLDRDPETGLLHEARLRGDLVQECARTRRYGQPFSLLIVVVEASAGAPSGPDAPLPVAADLVHAHVRASDAVYRLGPDAVAVLAPHTGVDGATSLAARLSQVLERRFAPAPEEPATPWARLRWEWVTVPDDADTAEAVLAHLREQWGLTVS